METPLTPNDPDHNHTGKHVFWRPNKKKERIAKPPAVPKGW